MSRETVGPAIVNASAPVVEVGALVWYVPDPVHQLDQDHQGNFLFDFYHATNYASKKISYRQGDRVEGWDAVGKNTRQWRLANKGLFRTGGGHLIYPGGPRVAWPAKIREVFADGTVALDIAHPIGGSLIQGHAAFEKGTFITLHYPKHGETTGLAYCKDGSKPHTWHLLTDTAGE